MAAALAGGYVWVRPTSPATPQTGVLFVEKAQSAGCQNRHTLCRLHPTFENIMPWLTSVGAAAAAADYDGDGDVDLYVTNCGPGDDNRLFRNRGDGTFEDVTADAGVGCGNPAGASMHAIWGDIDNDGDGDLYLVKWGAPNALYLNEGNGHFRDIAPTAGVDYWGYGNAATYLDFNRDGRLDLLLGNYFAREIVDPATGSLVRNDLWNPVSTKIMHETFTHARNGGHNVLYRNRGDGTFEDVTAKVGLALGGWTLAVGAGDLNNDGWPDLYIANDFGPDECYLNTGATQDPPTFRLLKDPRGHPGIGNDWWKGMNVDMADVNGDGYLDIYVTNILSHKYKTDEGNMLWLNCADGACPGGRGFRNAAKACGTQDGGWGWAGKFADFNNDGLLDVFTVNGFVTGDPERTYWYQIQEMVTQTKNQTVDARDWPVMGRRDLSGYEPSRLFIQVASKQKKPLADPQFVEAAMESGISDTFNGRGIALADFNLDGRLDIYVANQNAPSCYYVNQSAAADRGSFIRLKLVGAPDGARVVGGRRLESTLDAVGARVTLITRAGRTVREVQGGMGFASQSEYAVHMGVPDPAAVERIVVDWPSGSTSEVTGDTARAYIGHHVSWTEGLQPIMLK